MSDSKVNPKECPASIKHLEPPFHILYNQCIINSKTESTISNKTKLARRSFLNEFLSARKHVYKVQRALTVAELSLAHVFGSEAAGAGLSRQRLGM